MVRFRVDARICTLTVPHSMSCTHKPCPCPSPGVGRRAWATWGKWMVRGNPPPPPKLIPCFHRWFGKTLPFAPGKLLCIFLDILPVSLFPPGIIEAHCCPVYERQTSLSCPKRTYSKPGMGPRTFHTAQRSSLLHLGFLCAQCRSFACEQKLSICLSTDRFWEQASF